MGLVSSITMRVMRAWAVVPMSAAKTRVQMPLGDDDSMGESLFNAFES
jgi:hypothetical protein